MENKYNKVLTLCREQAKKSSGNLNVFDLMYETNLAYTELKTILDELVLKGELEVIDIKTYKFIGDINHRTEKADPLEEKLAYLEKRRQELIAIMQAEDANRDRKIEVVGLSEENELRRKALKLCIEKGQVSASLLQRSLPIGYIQSCRIMDWMEDMGYITAANGVEPRKVLITLDEFNETFGDSGCNDETLFYGNDEDEESDYYFAEYEKFLKSGEDVFDETENCEENAEKDRREELIAFLKTLLIEARATKSWEEIPEHPSWDNDNEFMRVCADTLLEIINSDKKTGRVGALKKAKSLLENVQKTRDKKIIQVYECIVFELRNMSNYYYIKIREGLL